MNESRGGREGGRNRRRGLVRRSGVGSWDADKPHGDSASEERGSRDSPLLSPHRARPHLTLQAPRPVWLPPPGSLSGSVMMANTSLKVTTLNTDGCRLRLPRPRLLHGCSRGDAELLGGSSFTIPQNSPPPKHRIAHRPRGSQRSPPMGGWVEERAGTGGSGT